jgi:hypothetical protein
MNSYQLLSFHEQAALPRFRVTEDSFKGMCLTNVDGRCISGGMSVMAPTGYRSAGLGFGMSESERIAAGMDIGGGYPTPADVMTAGGVTRRNEQGATCVGFPLFLAKNRPYELYGMEIAGNANKLRGLSPYLAMS